MRILRVFIPLFVSILFLPASANPRADSLANQYWQIRTSVVNDYMIGTGNGQGESLIGYRRVPTEDGHLKFGDNTIKLGIWISTLAMEYALLNRNQQPCAPTLEDLFHSLATINRLDLAAEPYFTGPDGQPGQQSLNGFMLRDDVDSLTTEQLERLNTDPRLIPVTGVTSDYLNHYGKNLRNIPSQDQVIYLMTGLAFVIRLLPDHACHQVNGINSVFIDGEYSLRQEAIRIMNRIKGYMNPAQWDWRLVNPVTQVPITGEMGGDGRSLSWGLYTSWQTWTGQDEWTGIRAIPFRTLFNSFQNPTVFSPIRNGGEGDKILTLAAISNAWGESSMESLIALSEDPRGEFDFPHIPLMYCVLFGEPFPAGRSDSIQHSFAQLLKLLPCAENPYNFGAWDDGSGRGSYASFEWSANYRVVEPEGRGETSPKHWMGNFSGFDWLFYHNLYLLSFPEQGVFLRPNLFQGPYVNLEGMRLDFQGELILTRKFSNRQALVISAKGRSDTLRLSALCMESSPVFTNEAGAVIRLSAEWGKSLVFYVDKGSTLSLEPGSTFIVGDRCTLLLHPEAEYLPVEGAAIQVDGGGMIIDLSTGR